MLAILLTLLTLFFKMNIRERIKFLFEKKNITQAQLARELNISRVTVNKWISTENAFGIESVRKLLTYFPDLNARWLILGEGDMLNTKSYSIKNEVSTLVADEIKKYDLSKKAPKKLK